MKQFEKVLMISNITHCSICHKDNMEVYDSRKSSRETNRSYGYIRRRKKCVHCGNRITTYEISEDDFKELQYLRDIKELTELDPSLTSGEYFLSKKIDKKFEELKKLICKGRGGI